MTSKPEGRYKTLGDVVREHAAEQHGGTDDGLRYLELRGSPEHNGAANLYLAALSIIAKQPALSAEVEQARKTAEYWKAEHIAANAEVERLRGALRELSDMYVRTWDREDGALVMMPNNIEHFEAAHERAKAALAKHQEAKS